jgi:hypothetical protein
MDSFRHKWFSATHGGTLRSNISTSTSHVSLPLWLVPSHVLHLPQSFTSVAGKGMPLIWLSHHELKFLAEHRSVVGCG